MTIDANGLQRARAVLGPAVQFSRDSGLAAAALSLLPELWALWQRHEGDVEAMRAELKAQNDLLARGRAEVDATLAAKRAAEGGGAP